MNELAGNGMGALKDIFGRFYDSCFPFIYHGHSLHDIKSLRYLMRDENTRKPQLSVQLADMF